jgi:hypothetical protein
MAEGASGNLRRARTFPPRVSPCRDLYRPTAGVSHVTFTVTHGQATRRGRGGGRAPRPFKRRGRARAEIRFPGLLGLAGRGANPRQELSQSARRRERHAEPERKARDTGVAGTKSIPAGPGLATFRPPERSGKRFRGRTPRSGRNQEASRKRKRCKMQQRRPIYAVAAD